MRSDITYVVIDTLNHTLSAQALERSNKRFPLENAIIFSDKADLWSGREIIEIPEIKSTKDYNSVLFFDLPKQLKTDFALFIQYDGFVLSGELFSEQYLNWDYIGAPWPHYSDFTVGNGGFSLRSKKLVNSIQKYLLPDDLNSAEDVVICRYLRARLEENDGLRFAPEKIAEMFSYEMRRPNFDTFGFHGLSNLPEVMVGEIEELFEYLQPQSVAKFFRSFSSACEKLPIDGKELFDQYCLRHQTEMLYHAKLNAKKQLRSERVL
jgi:hypothetical protein